MTLSLKSAAQELRELYGADAERICIRSAEHAEKDGMPAMARDWRDLAAEVVHLVAVTRAQSELGTERLP